MTTCSHTRHAGPPCSLLLHHTDCIDVPPNVWHTAPFTQGRISRRRRCDGGRRSCTTTTSAALTDLAPAHTQRAQRAAVPQTAMVVVVVVVVMGVALGCSRARRKRRRRLQDGLVGASEIEVFRYVREPAMVLVWGDVCTSPLWCLCEATTV